jgi:hypothetical protein
VHALEWLTTRPARAGLIILALALPCIGTARAQPADAREDAEKPWSKGIPVEQRQSAREIFLAGNKLFNEALFGKAAEKFKEALALLPHPFIYYNLAVAQINLGQHLEAYRSLQSALQYGAEHLGETKHQQAQSYLAMLEKQLARIEIVCAQPGVRVTLDGRILFDGPGTHEELVYAGEHQLVATRPGRVPATERVVLAPGQRVRVELDPLLPGGMKRERRWTAWRPWAVVGAGAVVGMAGGVAHWRSAHNFDEFGEELRVRGCATPSDEAGVFMGCPASAITGELDDTLDSARWQRRIAIGSYIAAGATVTTGLVLVYLNRARLVKVEPGSRAPAILIPHVSPESVGLSAQLHF